MVGVFKTTHVCLERLCSGAESEGWWKVRLHGRRWLAARLKLCFWKWNTTQTETMITESVFKQELLSTSQLITKHSQAWVSASCLVHMFVTWSDR